MKYYLDTEFSEGMRKPIWWLPTIGNFNKPKWGIELISIGIKCEDGRKYYAVSNEFNAATCNEWVVKNVLTKLPRKYLYEFPYDSPHSVVPDYGVGIGYKNPVYKSLKQIAKDVQEFCNLPEFYAYQADYKWVVFRSIFQAMINLPGGFPMYCKDLKQMLDELVDSMSYEMWSVYPTQPNENSAIDNAEWNEKLHIFISSLKKINDE